MTAKEMLEEQGFEQIMLENGNVKYLKNYGDDIEERITFLFDTQKYKTNVAMTDDKRWFKAIQQQIKELGWND